MESSDAAREAVGDVEATVGPEIYALAPRADFFLGEAVLATVAAGLISSFLRGLTDGLNDQAEQWGKEVSVWLRSRLGAAIENAAAVGADALDTLPATSEVDQYAQEARRAIARTNKTDQDLQPFLESAEVALRAGLVQNGVSSAVAENYAGVVRHAALPLLRPS